MKIIDAHAHVVQYIAGTGSQGELRACGGGYAAYATGESFLMIPPEIGEYDATPEALLKIMDAHNVEKAVLLQGNYFGFQNQYTYEAVKKYPSRFIGAATYDPFCLQKERIRKHLFEELNFRIIKFEVSNGSGLMSYHPTVDLDGEIMHDVYSHAAKCGLTFVIDIGRPRNNCYQVDALANAIRKYPEMNFVICHLLAPQLGDDELLKQSLEKLALPNVYFDIAALCLNSKPQTYPYPAASQYLRYGLDIVGEHRLMWGSDMPSAMTKDSYQHFIDFVAKNSLLSATEKENIFYHNANHIYFGA